MSDIATVLIGLGCILNGLGVVALARRVKALESKPKQSVSYNISVPGRKEGP